MNCSAEKASRKWAYGVFGRTARQWLPLQRVVLLGVSSEQALAAKGTRLAPWGDLFGAGPPEVRRTVHRSAVPLPRPRPADAPTSRARPSQRRSGLPRQPSPTAEQAAPAPQPRRSLGLPAGADRRHRHRPQHSRHPWRRRLRRRRSGAARGHRAAGQAAGVGEARGDPALRHGLCAGRLDPDRHRAARDEPRQHDQRSRQFRFVRVPRPQPYRRRQLSEHGRANALDVRAFKLANGRSISLTDRTVPRELRETVLHSACARFSTVLGPGSDWYHEDHIHLDLMERRGNYRICQWNVWDPLPQVAPLLPAERPEEAPPREVAAKSDDAKPDAGKLGKPKRRRMRNPKPPGPKPKPVRNEQVRNKKAPAEPALLIVLCGLTCRLLHHRAARRPAAPSSNCTASRRAWAPAPPRPYRDQRGHRDR